MLTRTQVKMARTALGWGVRDLASQAGLATNTVSRFENGADITLSTLAKIQAALEEEGIVFVPRDEHGGPGVRLRE